MVDVFFALLNPLAVAPLAGSVDRNDALHPFQDFQVVAPLAGSVDRNVFFAVLVNTRLSVAPLAGSVDRNITYLAT